MTTPVEDKELRQHIKDVLSQRGYFSATPPYTKIMQLVKARDEQREREIRIDENRDARIDLSNLRFDALISMRPLDVHGIDKCIDALDDRYKALTQPPKQEKE